MADEDIHIRRGSPKPLEVGDKVFQSVHDWELSEKDLEKAARELGENEERKTVCLRELKEKLSNDTETRYRQDDFYLLRFLRVRKYDVGRAYQNVKLFYELRKKHSNFFHIPLDLKIAQEINWVVFLPYADEEGRIIMLLNFNRWHPHEKSFEEMMQTAHNMSDLISLNPKCQINGVIALYDLGGMTFKHATELLWKGRLFACLQLSQNGYPWRIKKLIVLHTNGLVRILYNFLKPLMGSKLVERCVLLGSDMAELHQHVNPVLLPKRLGGSLEEDECDVSQHILKNSSYIRYESVYEVYSPELFTIKLLVVNQNCFFSEDSEAHRLSLYLNKYNLQVHRQERYRLTLALPESVYEVYSPELFTIKLLVVNQNCFFSEDSEAHRLSLYLNKYNLQVHRQERYRLTLALPERYPTRNQSRKRSSGDIKN